MKRENLLKTKEYWTTHFQVLVFNLIEDYRKANNLNQTQLANELGVTKGYISQVLNGDYDHKISKLIELCLAFGKAPIIKFTDLNEFVKNDIKNKKPLSVKHGVKKIGSKRQHLMLD